MAKINVLSWLAQIVQIGTISPLLSLSLQQRKVSPVVIGLIISASWVAILAFYKMTPRFLHRFGLVKSSGISAAISVVSILGLSYCTNLVLLFILNLLMGIGLILRWVACDTWIVAITTKEGRGRAIGLHETLMGLGIAMGPLLIAFFGVDTSAAYYASAIIAGVSGALGFTLLEYNIFPPVPHKKKDRKLLPIIPLALSGAFIAGFAETSAVSFLGGYGIIIGYTVSAAAILVSTFGFGGTILLFPIGFLADKLSCRTAQLFCSLTILLSGVVLAFASSCALLTDVVVFVLGGAVGGLITLAVIEAGNTLQERQMSTAMSAISMFYTVGSIAGPVVTGAMISYLNARGLMVSIGLIGSVGFLLLLFRAFRHEK